MSTATHEAATLLSALFRAGDVLELRPIETWVDGGKKESRILGRKWLTKSEEFADAFEWLRRLNTDEHANAFFGVCPREKPGVGTAKDVRIVRAFWADVDNCEPAGALLRCEDAGLPTPSIVVCSGTGVHLYWLLDGELHIETEGDRERVETIIANIGKPIGSCATQDLSRVLRLPGFDNVKDRRRGKPPTRCYIVTCDTDRVYAIAEFEAFYPNAKEPTSPPPSGDPLARLNAATRQEIELLIRGLDSTPIGGRSEADFHTIRIMFRAGLTPAECWAVLCSRSKFAERGRKYFELTVAKLGPQESSEIPDEWKPVKASKLAADESKQTWYWHGFLGAGLVTLLIGIWKAGKSTLLAHLLKCVTVSGSLGTPTFRARVLVISEEPKSIWRQRYLDIGFDGDVEIISRPFRAKPSQKKWESFIDYVAGLVAELKINAVLLDTLQNHWPVVQENDASEVSAALMPIHAITAAGAAVLLAHHPRKSDGEEGTASRGSGALPGFADVIVELRRFAPQVPEDRKRTLKTYSRFTESPAELVIELTDDGYRPVGTKATAVRADRMAVVLAMLPDAPDGLTIAEIRDGWASAAVVKPSAMTLRTDLTAESGVLTTGGRNEGRPAEVLQMLFEQPLRGGACSNRIVEA